VPRKRPVGFGFLIDPGRCGAASHVVTGSTALVLLFKLLLVLGLSDIRKCDACLSYRRLCFILAKRQLKRAFVSSDVGNINHKEKMQLQLRYYEYSRMKLATAD